MTSPLDKKGIAEEFAAKQKHYTAAYDKSGSNQTIAKLADIVSGLRDAGLDVSIEFSAAVSSQAFAMLAESSATAEGVLRMGMSQRMVCIFNKQSGVPCLKVVIGSRNIQHGNSTQTLSPVAFDVKDDTEAWLKLQRKIIDWAADQAVIDTVSGQDGGKVHTRKDMPFLDIKVKP